MRLPKWGPAPSGRGAPSQPTALGLVGISLAAMFVTLLLIQTFLGDFRTDEEPAEEDRAPAVDATPPSGTARFMVAGDSTVQGSSGDHTWRYRLWSHLDEQDVDMEFVGPYDDLLDVNAQTGGDDAYAEPEFDRAHAAVWGATAQDVAADIGEQVAEHEPDYLLLAAGINDLVNGASVQDALDNVAEAVVTARVGHGDDLQVILGEVTPVWDTNRDAPLNERIHQFNQGLPALAEQLTGEDSPVVVAPSAEDYAPAEDNWDTAHPNARGELKIAAAFADTLSESLGVGEPYPRPLPNVEVGPREETEVDAEEDGGEVVLTWDPVPGATHYQVLQQRLQPERDERVPLPMEVDGVESDDDQPRSATVDHLLSGATYEFSVRPFKGNNAGRPTEPVRIGVDTTPPDSPESVRVEDGDTQLVWSEVADADRYEVWQRPLDCEPAGDERECEPWDGQDPDSGEEWTVGAVVEDQTEWAITDESDEGHEYVVRAYRDFLPGEYSDPVSASVDTGE